MRLLTLEGVNPSFYLLKFQNLSSLARSKCLRSQFALQGIFFLVFVIVARLFFFWWKIGRGNRFLLLGGSRQLSVLRKYLNCTILKETGRFLDSALPTSSSSSPEVQTWLLTQAPFASCRQSILEYSGQFGARPSMNGVCSLLGCVSSVVACSLLHLGAQPASQGSCLIFSLFLIGPLFGNLGVVLATLFPSSLTLRSCLWGARSVAWSLSWGLTTVRGVCSSFEGWLFVGNFIGDGLFLGCTRGLFFCLGGGTGKASGLLVRVR